MTKDQTAKAIQKIKTFSKTSEPRKPQNVLEKITDYSLVGADFSHLNLSGIIFQDENLGGVNFSEANLENAQFINVKLQKSKFSCTNLKNAYFEKTQMNSEKLQECTCLENIDGLSKKVMKELETCHPHLMEWQENDVMPFFIELFGKKCQKWPTSFSKDIGVDPWNNSYIFTHRLEQILKDLIKTPRTTEEIVRYQLDECKIFKLMENKRKSVEKFKMSVPKNEIPSKVWSAAQKKAFFYLYQSITKQGANDKQQSVLVLQKFGQQHFAFCVKMAVQKEKEFAVQNKYLVTKTEAKHLNQALL